MQRNLILAAMMVLAAVPAASAHLLNDQIVGPHLNCQDTLLERKYHDYLPPNTGYLVIANEGNIEDCPKPNDIQIGVFNETGTVCTTLNGVVPQPPGPIGPPICGAINTGIDQPLLDYDGEFDHAIGGAFLFVETGDGLTSGVTACFGWPAIGHHSTTVYVFDNILAPLGAVIPDPIEPLLIKGPTFSVTADYSRPGEEGTPDCGDSLVEPCDPLPPEPSTQPFPVNVVIDTVNGVLYGIFGPGGAGCNVLDNAQRCFPDPATKPGPTRCVVAFGPGADGAIVVFVEPNFNQPHIPLGGHIWTA